MKKIITLAVIGTIAFLSVSTLSDAAAPVAQVEALTSEMEIEWIPPVIIHIPADEIEIVSCSISEDGDTCFM
tara:strand:- start:9765 stop:9980 length:216 start_codon:yes stop_codon:yes gene_type:complete